MLIITYDISNTKIRTKFSKYLLQYGRRVQYSVFEIKNSQRILQIITTEIKNIYEPLFSKSDSILIFKLPNPIIYRYGYAKNEEKPIVFM